MSDIAVAAAPTLAPRSLSGRDIPTLESLYEAAGGVNFTPGWVPRKKPILWGEPRPEFVPAFQAWLAQDPLNNPAATPSPLLQPEYHVADLERSDRLERQGSQHFENGKEATERTDSYVLSTVFFASVLFFAGISMRFVWQKMRITVLVLATLTLAYGVVQIATLPVL